MINYIWCFFIILGVIFSYITGRISDVNNSIFKSANETIQLTINLFGNICFWSGIINIIDNTSIKKWVKALIGPIYKFLFNKLDVNSKAYEYITINGFSNLLGLGNASTPSGIAAMNELEKICEKEELSEEMVMFIAINTASLQIIPTTIIGIRNSLGTSNPANIIIAVWFSSVITL